MIEVHYELGEYKVVQIDERPSGTFITSMYLDDMEADELMWKLMAQIEKAP